MIDRTRLAMMLSALAAALVLVRPVAAAVPAPIERLLADAQANLMRNPAMAVDRARSAHAAIDLLPADDDRVLGGARADWIMGAALAGLNQPVAATRVLDRGLRGGILRVAPRSKIAADLYMARAVALIFNNNVEAALPSLQRAYRLYVELGDRRSQALALQNISSIYLAARDFDRALRYNSQAAETFSGDPALMISLLNSRGTVLIEQGRFDDAATMFQRAYVRAQAMGSDVLAARFLASLARAQLAAGQTDQADASVRRAFATARRVELGDWMPALYWTAAEIARTRGRLDAAAALIDRTFAGVDLAKPNLSIRDYLRSAYEIFKARGEDGKALRYLEAYKQVDDQSRAIAASAAAALMSARFDYVNQEAQIRQLHATQEAQAAAAGARLRATILNAALLAAFVILALLLFGYISLRRSRDQVRAANADLSQSNAALEKALAARTEFLAMTSHEIRTPLNGILGMTQVLLADRALDPPVRGKIELVHGAGETMKALVNDLLDIAKMTTGEITIHKAEMDLARLLRDAEQVWSAQAQSRGLRLALDAQVPARIVEDEVRLRQIVFNLMANAIKFTDQGEVRLTATAVPAADGERLRVTVADSGIGIPPEKLEEIFESFRQVDAGVTRRHGGTGLGLAICRNLAHAMGGDVTVTSVVGAGSTFLVDLPLERVAEIAPEPCRPAVAATLAESTLLAVEANPISQSVLRSVLEGHAAQVHAVAGRDEAARMLAVERIDLVLADGATLGLDLAAAGALAAAAARRGARTVLLWPRPDEALHAAAAAAGIARVIGKPISAADLVADLESLYSDAAREHLAA